MKERRKYVRSDGLVLVNYKMPSLKLEGKSSAFDIGGAGIRISLERNLEVGILVEMEIYLPGDSQPILAKGETVWSHKCKEKASVQIGPKKEYFYAGIKFSLIDDRNRNRIINYVNRKLHQIR